MCSILNIWILFLAFFGSGVLVSDTRSIPNVDTKAGQIEFLSNLGFLEWGGRTAVTDEELRVGITRLQSFYNLPLTGIVDDETRPLLEDERCGVSDLPTLRMGRFDTASKIWGSDIRWRLNWTHQAVPAAVAESVMDEILQEWLKWMATITITKSTDTDSEVIINYVMPDDEGYHGDNSAFRYSTIAHAFYPGTHRLSGDLHYNMKKTFSTSEPPPYNELSLRYVTAHELGHTLGMKHSNVQNALMYAYLGRGDRYPGLSADDILGIQSLYGECLQSPCKNGGTCTHNTVMPRYTCRCPTGFRGTNCEITACNPSPCDNGGTCVDGSGGYTCNCLPSYTGTDCETVNHCASSPCENGGTCSLSGNGYTCDCTTDYTGTNCENLLPCSGGPCKNGGTCTNDAGEANGYRCQCPASHMGPTCVQTTPCYSNPCENGGSCSPATNSLGYSCQCTNSYTGDKCSASKCDNNPCRNGGSCSLDPNASSGYKCRCTATYRGPTCQDAVCTTGPCDNGGTCTEDPSRSTGYTCACPDDVSGDNCQNTGMISSSGLSLQFITWLSIVMPLVLCHLVLTQ